MGAPARGAALCCLLLLLTAGKPCATKEYIEGLLPENCTHVNKPGAEDDGKPLLSTPYGMLHGKSLSTKGTERMVQGFFGIPFAKPPIGPLRFTAPEAPEPWEGVREATEQPPMCLQVQSSVNITGKQVDPAPTSEDCLYLNVYTPADRGHNPRLPVMVFIHGGALISGGAMMLDGSALSAYENVVVVFIQYRLSILGFFSTGDARLPGNYGFLDQVAALRWVQENIKAFGGNPNSVTIFGESAGGICVAALVLSPLAKGLFHRAIAESGVAIFPGLVAVTPEEVAPFQQILVNASGCDMSALVECLKEKSEEEMKDLITGLKMLAFPGVADGIFLPKPAEQIMAEKEMNPVPFLIGVTEQEFGWLIPMVFNLIGQSDGMERESISTALHGNPWLGTLSAITPLLLEEYIRDVTDPAEIRNRFLDMCGDFVFVMPALKTAKYHRDAGHPVFFYEFRRRPDIFKDLKPEYVKADHGDELYFAFGGPFLPEGLLFSGPSGEEEEALSRSVMKYWANFARTGNPNGPGLVHWPQYDGDEGYLQMDIQQTAAQRLKEDKYEFWYKILPERMAGEQSQDHSEL